MQLRKRNFYNLITSGMKNMFKEFYMFFNIFIFKNKIVQKIVNNVVKSLTKIKS